MGGRQNTIRLTTAQAIIRFLQAQWIEIDEQRLQLCGGGFGIFGHGNVTCLGEALYDAQDTLPLYRGQNEQGMGLAAAAYAKTWARQRFMFCTASAGPGTSNLLTAAALAHANRLPVLMLCGDTFATRLPDPVLQQLEHFQDPTLGVNDAFRPMTRYWDRITHPAQIIQSLPQALATMLDPADCGPAFIGLPQDVQGWVYDYPLAFFEDRTHRIRSQAADPRDITAASDLIKAAKKPMIVAGGGVQYGHATQELRDFAQSHNIPVVETIAGRANLVAQDAHNIGPIGVTGSNSANQIAQEADLIIAVGTRLQDFTTGSWTAFDQGAKLINLNVGRHDAGKHMGVSVVGDCKQSLPALSDALGTYQADESWLAHAQSERKKWDGYVAKNIDPGNGPASYAQVVGAVNRMVDPADRIVASAGGLPAEVTANWRSLSQGSVDVEFGYSCMGYEISGAWGAAIAMAERAPDRDVVTFCGDGSYMMMNSEIYSSVLTGKKIIVILCDNGGFAVINKLQNNTGNESFNNLIADTPTAIHQHFVDFTAHARAMGAKAERVESMADFDAAFARAQASESTYLIEIKTDPYEGWTAEGHAWWEVGTPHVTDNPKVAAAHKDWEATRPRQRKGV